MCALGPGVSGPPVGSPVFALVGTGPQTATGGYAEYAVADAARVLPLPPGLAPDVACSLLVAGFTALVSLREIARLEHGQHVLVLVQAAAGGVGSYAVQLARAGGDEARALTGGRGADVVLESGGATSFPDALAALAPFGQMVVMGYASGAPLALDAGRVERFFYAPAPNQSLHALNIGGWFLERPGRSAALLEELVGHVLAGRVRAKPGERVPLTEAASAHAPLGAREALGKIVLTP